MTHPEPDDPDTTHRMRTAHHHARHALNVHITTHPHETWGWHGRTLSTPVIAPDGPAWLRLAAAPTGETNHIFWTGSLDSRDTIPTTVPRPRLRDIHDWTTTTWAYRAELYDHIDTHPISPTAALETIPDLPGDWWTDLHTALDTITSIPTQRHTTDQPYLDWAMPKFLGTPINTHVATWTTAHGDLHWANITAPPLQILDWEGWGLAPIGYDAAILHTHSLLTPLVAERVRREFAAILDTPAGQFAELVAITELLHSTTRGDHLPLVERLHQRAVHLLDTCRTCF